MVEESRRITEYERLRRFFLWHRGKFALGLVRVNHPRQRDGIVASLREELGREGVTLLVRNLSQRQVRSLNEELRRDEELGEHLARDSQRVALALVGLEPSIETHLQPGGNIPTLVPSLNLERDAISLGYPVPITLWLTDYAMDRLAEAAVDFFDFKSGVFVFRSAPTETPMQREEIARLEEAGAELPPELLQERLDVLEDRISELKRRGGLEPAEKERLAELLAAMGETYLASQDAKIKTQGIPYLREARQLYVELGKRREEAEALARIAAAYYWADQNRLAKERYQEALPIYREIGARLGDANTVRSLGNVHMALAEYEEARRRYQEALPIFREIGDRLGEANTIQSLGDVHRSQEDYASALARCKEAMAIYRDIGDRYSIGRTLRLMGWVWREQEEIQSAMDAFRKAGAIFGEIGVRYWEERCREIVAELEEAER